MSRDLRLAERRVMSDAPIVPRLGDGTTASPLVVDPELAGGLMARTMNGSSIVGRGAEPSTLPPTICAPTAATWSRRTTTARHTVTEPDREILTMRRGGRTDLDA